MSTRGRRPREVETAAASQLRANDKRRRRDSFISTGMGRQRRLERNGAAGVSSIGQREADMKEEGREGEEERKVEEEANKLARLKG